MDWGVKEMPGGSRICLPFSAILTNGDDVRWIADSRYNDPEYTDPADPTNTAGSSLD